MTVVSSTTFDGGCTEPEALVTATTRRQRSQWRAVTCASTGLPEGGTRRVLTVGWRRTGHISTDAVGQWPVYLVVLHSQDLRNHSDARTASLGAPANTREPLFVALGIWRSEAYPTETTYERRQRARQTGSARVCSERSRNDDRHATTCLPHRMDSGQVIAVAVLHVLRDVFLLLPSARVTPRQGRRLTPRKQQAACQSACSRHRTLGAILARPLPSRATDSADNGLRVVDLLFKVVMAIRLTSWPVPRFCG